MNRHFSVINKRGVVTASVLLFLTIVLFSISMSRVLGGGSRLWLIPVFVFIVLFIIFIMILISVLTAGIDIKDDIVILPDLDPSKGKQPKFNIKDLQDVQLQDGNSKVLNPYRDNLVGARIAFLLDGGTRELYYPVAVTAKQFEKIRSGMIEGLSH